MTGLERPLWNMENEEKMTIYQAGRKYQISADTLRYYKKWSDSLRQKR